MSLATLGPPVYKRLAVVPLLGQSGTTSDAHIASLSASNALPQFPLLALLDVRFNCSEFLKDFSSQ